MKLYVKDRIILMQVIPSDLELTFSEFVAKKELMRKVVIDEEARARFNITSDEKTGMVKWDVEKDMNEPLEITVSDTMASLLRMIIEGLAEKKFGDSVWDTLERVYDSVQGIGEKKPEASTEPEVLEAEEA